jgi:hypothetical protein
VKAFHVAEDREMGSGAGLIPRKGDKRDRGGEPGHRAKEDLSLGCPYEEERDRGRKCSFQRVLLRATPQLACWKGLILTFTSHQRALPGHLAQTYQS